MHQHHQHQLSSSYSSYPTTTASHCVSPSPLVSAAMEEQLDYLHDQLPDTASKASDAVSAERSRVNVNELSVVGIRFIGTALRIQGRNMQETSLTNYDLFFSIGAFLLDLSQYSVSRIMRTRNPTLSCRASDSNEILRNYSDLRTKCSGLSKRVHKYEAAKMGFRLRTDLECLYNESGSNVRRLGVVTRALVAGMQGVTDVGRYGF